MPEGRGLLRGHMARAWRALRRHLAEADLVLEVADARAPALSRNPHLERLAAGKPRVLVLARADLAAEGATRRWLAHFARQGMRAVAVDAVRGTGVARLRSLLPRGGRALVVGLPNVGKSSLINRLAGRARAATGALPGVTRGPQWIRVGESLLLDLPGILPPYLRRPGARARLVALGLAGPEACPLVEAAQVLIGELRRAAPRELEASYGLDSELGPPEEVLAAIGRRRGCLRAGGEVDRERAAALLLRDFRRGRLGRVTLEEPGPPGEEAPPAAP